MALRSRLILDGDRIELRSGLGTSTATRDEIEGLRTIDDQYGRRTRICLKETRGGFNVPCDSFTGNGDLNEWLKGLPDLDQQDADEVERQISNQDTLGVDGNLHTLKQAKAWAIGWSIAAGVVSIPVIFVSYTPIYTASLALLVLFPPLGILLIRRFPLLFTIFKRKVDPRADIGFVVIWPGIGTLLSYQTGNGAGHLVDASGLIYWVILIVVFYVAALFRTVWENPSRWGVLAGLLLLGCMYSVGLVDAANTIPDRSVPRLYRTQVLKKYVTQGRHASFCLGLAPWGPISFDDDVIVPGRIYRQVKLGDQICIGLHPGFLHAPWYTLTPCNR